MVVQSIPIVDFAKFEENPNKVAQQVFDACKSIGFFYIINHNIPQGDIDKAFELVIIISNKNKNHAIKHNILIEQRVFQLATRRETQILDW